MKKLSIFIFALILAPWIAYAGLLTGGGCIKDCTRTGASIEENLTVTGGIDKTAKFLVYSDGTNYTVYDGHTNAIASTGTNAVTAIQYALDNLTGSRTHKEKVVLKGVFTLSANVTVSDYTILDMSGAILKADGATWNPVTDKEVIGNTNASAGNDHIEIIGGKIKWIFVEDVLESTTGGATDTITMTAMPFAEGDKVLYYVNATECGISKMVSYSLCNKTDADTTQLDATIGCGGDCSTCDSKVEITTCGAGVPTGTFKEEPSSDVSGIQIVAQVNSTRTVYTPTTPTCIGTCANTVTVATTHGSCTSDGNASCWWQGYRDTTYEIDIITAATPDTFKWRAKYTNCTQGDACWSAWSSTAQNAEESVGGIEITHTDTNLIEFSNNLHLIWDAEDGGDTDDIWTVIVPYSEDILISNVEIEDMYAHSVSFIYATDIVVEKSELHGHGDDGVSLTKHSSHASISKNNIYGGDSRKGGTAGVEIEDGSAFVTIEDNDITNHIALGEGSTASGIKTIIDTGVTLFLAPKNVNILVNRIINNDGGLSNQGNSSRILTNISVLGNTIIGRGEKVGGNVKHGVSLSYTKFNTISNNVISDHSGNCIFVADSDKNIITDNPLSRCDDAAGSSGSSAIRLHDSDYNLVTGNILNDDRTTSRMKGILLESTSDYNVVTDNILGRLEASGSNLSFITNSGTNNIIKDNQNDSLVTEAGGAYYFQSSSGTIPAHGTTQIRSWTTGPTAGTLDDGDYFGQLKRIIDVLHSSAQFTLSLPKWVDADRTDSDALDTCLFDAVDEYIILRWNNVNWVTESKTCTWTDD